MDHPRAAHRENRSSSTNSSAGGTTPNGSPQAQACPSRNCGRRRRGDCSKLEQLHALAWAVYYEQRGRISAREVYDQVNPRVELPAGRAGCRLPLRPCPVRLNGSVAYIARIAEGEAPPGGCNEAWRDNLPEALAGSRTAELLDEVCDVDLDAVDVELPRGFGRDRDPPRRRDRALKGSLMPKTRAEIRDRIRELQDQARQRAPDDLIQFLTSRDPAWVAKALDEVLLEHPFRPRGAVGESRVVRRA